jgi:hypothetical protein
MGNLLGRVVIITQETENTCFSVATLEQYTYPKPACPKILQHGLVNSNLYYQTPSYPRALVLIPGAHLHISTFTVQCASFVLFTAVTEEHTPQNPHLLFSLATDTIHFIRILATELQSIETEYQPVART